MDGSERASVADALAGDREAFRTLVERHSPAVFRLAWRMTGNEHDAEDVVQETFWRAWRRLPRFESRSSFGTWVYRIAANCSLDLIRKRKSEFEIREQSSREGEETVLEVPSPSPAPDREALSEELGRQVEAAMAKLSETERVAFTLRHFEGWSIREIGRELNLKTSATKNTVFRAVAKLRRALEPLVVTVR